MRVALSRRCDDQPEPAGQEAKAADRGDRAQPAKVCDREQVKAAAEDQHTREQQRERAPARCAMQRKGEERYCVGQMVEDRFVPGVDRAVRLEHWLQAMRSERAERHGKEAKCARDPEERHAHTVEVRLPMRKG